jgi:hypothetical protein
MNRGWSAGGVQPGGEPMRHDGLNPYQSPRAGPVRSRPPAEGPSAWRDGDYVVGPRAIALPPVCLRCGAEASGAPFTTEIRWRPKFALALLLFPPFYLLASLRTTVHVSYWLCQSHRREHQGRVTRGVMLLGVGLACWGLAAYVGWLQAPLFLLGAVVMPGGIWYADRSTRWLRYVKADAQWVWLRGAAGELLAHLPPWGQDWRPG